jgi:hypothetical protein
MMWLALAVVAVVAVVAGIAIYEAQHKCCACHRGFGTVAERQHHEKRAHQI